MVSLIAHCAFTFSSAQGPNRPSLECWISAECILLASIVGWSVRGILFEEEEQAAIMTHYSSIEVEEIGRRAWKTASRAAKHMSKHSKIVNPSMEKCIPRFEREEVILGEVLGSGGFNDVYEVKSIRLVEDLAFAEHAKKISSPLQAEHRSFVAKHVFRESSQNCRYAIKFLSVETIEDPSRFCTGAADLVVVRGGSNDQLLEI